MTTKQEATIKKDAANNDGCYHIIIKVFLILIHSKIIIAKFEAMVKQMLYYFYDYKTCVQRYHLG